MGADRQPARDAGAVRRRLHRAVHQPGSGRAGPPAGERDPGGSGLQLHPDKTRIACLARGREGFDFLGFHLHKVESWRWRGRYYLQRWPSDRAMAQVRAKIREATDRRYVGYPVAWVVGRLNRVLRGWGAYFRYGNSARKFAHVDAYVHERLATFASIKHGRHGRNYHRSPGVVHQPGGLPPQRTRAERRCACLTVNDVGKPCAGECAEEDP